MRETVKPLNEDSILAYETIARRPTGGCWIDQLVKITACRDRNALAVLVRKIMRARFPEAHTRVIVKTEHDSLWLEMISGEMFGSLIQCWAQDSVEPHIFQDGRGLLRCQHLDADTQRFSICISLAAQAQVHGVLQVALADVPCGRDRVRAAVDTSRIAHQLAGQLATLDYMERLEKLSLNDVGTGLMNRASLRQRLPGELARARRLKHPLSLAMIDLDRLKEANDSGAGHAGGDQILLTVANHLKHSLRKEDTAYRYAGDEFVLLLPDADVLHAAERLEKIISEIRELPQLPTVPLTVSIGLSELLAHCPNEVDGEMLLSKADQALYEAKRAGRNRLVIWTDAKPRAVTRPVVTAKV
jgi:diguanylate cyclase (GGDEF)-like protein